MEQENIDSKTVASFGDEWSSFDQSELPEAEATKLFQDYFKIFPWNALPPNAEGFDMGCGTGRWAAFIAPKVGKLNCLDPSDAIEVAKLRLSNFDNTECQRASIDENLIAECSQDFGYALGVLHHLPDPSKGMQQCVKLLKPGAPFLVYLYYALDNRSGFFRLTWKTSDLIRQIVAKLPPPFKRLTSEFLAVLVYWPLSRASSLLEKLGLDVSGIPLSFYRNHSLYTMRTDSRDRFGTPIEHRFTQEEIKNMMLSSGLRDIKFSESAPFWCAIGKKSTSV